MNTLWHKIWADLWLSKTRTWLAVASIAAGVFCVGTLFGMIALQLDKMDAAHRQSQPSHINLILRNDASLTLLEQIKAIKGVANIDSMTQLSVRFRADGANSQLDWDIGTLIIRPDYAAQKFDISSLESGSWPTPDHIAIERLSAKFTGLKAGDQIEFETAAGVKAMPIAGTIRHPFVKPPSFGGQIHFFADASTAAQFGIAPNSFRQLLVQTTPPYSAEQTRNIAQQIRSLLNDKQIAVNVTLLQDPEKHWGRPFFAGINGVLKIMALVSLALASVLILNTLSAHITQQTEQIGVMKALGCRTFTIARLYLTETLLMALAAITLAVPLSIVAAHVSSCKLLALFNIDCGQLTISSAAIGYMLLGGLLAPLLAALYPVLRGAAMPVREAIASYGLGADFGSKRFDLWLERLGARLLPTLYAAALGNLFRRKQRLILTQSVLIIAGVMFMVLMSLIASVNLTLDQEMARSAYSVRLGFSSDQSERRVLELAKALAGTLQAEVWQRLPMDITQNGVALRQTGSLGAQLLAVPAATQMYRPLIETGRWLQATDAGQRVLVLSADTAALNHIKAGDALSIRLGAVTQEWLVIGTYRWLAGTNYAVEPVYAPLESVRDITGQPDAAAFVLLNAAIGNLAEEADYMRALKKAFQEDNIKLDIYTTQAKLEQRQFARNQFNPVIGTLLGLAAMIATVGAIGLSGTLAIGVLQRSREIGVLRAIGAPSAAIYRLFMLEGLLHGLFAWSLSVPLAYFAAEPIAHQLGKTMLGMQLDYRFDLPAIAYWLGMLILLAWMAAYWPARKAAQLSVQDCLAH